MNKMWAILSVAVVLASLSCTKSEIVLEEVAPAQIRSSESVQSPDKAEIARLHSVVAEAKKEIKALQEINNTLFQANRGLAEGLLAAKDALKAKEAERAVLSADLEKALETGSKGKRVLMAQIAELNKKNNELIASQESLSKELVAANNSRVELGGEMSALRTSHQEAIKGLEDRLKKKDTELIRAGEKRIKLIGVIAALVFLQLVLFFVFQGLASKSKPVLKH